MLCPAIKFSRKDVRQLENTVLKGLWCRDQNEAVFPLGYGPYFLKARKRSVPPNVRGWYLRSENILEFRAMRNIARGEVISALRQMYFISEEEHLSGFARDAKTFVGTTMGKGRGIFAEQELRPRNFIGRYPVLLVPSREREYIFDSVLDRYHSVWAGNDIAIVLGLWMLHNTTNEGSTRTTNAIARINTRERMMENYAIKHIGAGEEITIPYRDRSEPIEKLSIYGIEYK